ncbi:MAG: xanthine dehydrogenase molybdenum-binding subunit XdhA [Spirochaetaceae bacterium]|jgi:xanthine dehydrogenase molybdenum-binding subunit|nr:xanthine dehydrogenase molybdenum-binding subunit XdhA [Spirochaetaceae bacterium]
MCVGKSIPRVDAFEKVTGRAKYTDDLCERNVLVARILHSTVANGLVKKIDTAAAARLPGVVKVVTCFDAPDRPFPTAGHPWSTDPAHQDPADRKLLNTRVRLYGDDIAAVIAEDEVAASRALRAIKVEYEEYPPLLTVEDAMAEGAARLHEGSPGNVLKHTAIADGDFDAAVREEGLIEVEAVYRTPVVQHCHIENAVSFAYMEKGRVVVVSSTQIPHIARRIIAQALGLPWGKVRVIKPFVGGGFGNKQDALYEPLNAWLTTLVGGRTVKLELSREEVFFGTRVRHGLKMRLRSFLRPDGTFVARSYEAYSNQGAYGSHGHSIAAKGTNVFRQLYNRNDAARKCEIWTVYTNTATGGAMRGYGTPQTVFAIESHMEDIAAKLRLDPIAFRFKNLMPVGYVDPFSKNKNFFPSFEQCVEKGKAYIDWDRKRAAYRNDSGPVRRGVGMALFWYNTAVWPISIEVSACRMVLNQDGSVQIQLAETEIGQGADTVFTQMAADAIGIRWEDVHAVTTQDTDVTPFGTGAYGSRQTYVGSAAIVQATRLLREKILVHAARYTGLPAGSLDLVGGNIVNSANRVLCPLSEVATDTLYHTEYAEHITAESTAQVKTNAYSFGCTFAEVEVDIPLAKVRLVNMVNCHDAGRLINPLLAEGQVHGGMSMAAGFGMSEELLYDPATGKPLNANLLDYKLPTMLDHPPFKAIFVENPEPTSPFGTKALGEPPTVSGAAAIRNAVFHATGVAVNRIPLTPHILFEAFKEAGLV